MNTIDFDVLLSRESAEVQAAVDLRFRELLADYQDKGAVDGCSNGGGTEN